MRLYSPKSCTPVGSSSSKWSPPKTYLPKRIRSHLHNNLDEREHSVTTETHFSSSREKEGRTSGRASTALETSRPHREPNLHAIRPSFLFDIDNDETTDFSDGASNVDYEDEASRMSSSTLSSHTTLHEIRHFTSSPNPQKTYGIKMPFPALSKGAPSQTDNNISTPNEIHPANGKSLLPECKTPVQAQLSDNPFEVLQGGVYTNTKHIDTPRKCKIRPSGKASGHYVLAGKLEKLSLPHDFTHDSAESHPCPQLTMTESSEDSVWQDFSSEDSYNPFFEESFYAGRAKRRANSFSPIDKAPLQTQQFPVVTSKPCPRKASDKVMPLYASQQLRLPVKSNKLEHQSFSGVGTDHMMSGQRDCSSFRVLSPSPSRHRNSNEGRTCTDTPIHARAKVKITAPRKDSEHIHVMLSPPKGQKERSSGKGAFAKYSTMLKSGFSLDCVRKTMARDHVDPSIMDLVSLVSLGARR